MKILRAAAALAALALMTGCPPTPQANPVFSDATLFTFVEFDDPEPANLAFAARQLEREIYLSVDVAATNVDDRALAPEPLANEDVAGLDEIPDVYPEGFASEGEPIQAGRALGVAVVGLSGHLPAEHTGYVLLADQVPVEPASPDHYDRTFDEGADCFADRSCEFLRTTNDVTKDNAAMTATYILRKDYRWVDLNLPDPAEVPEGEPIVNEGPERWALIARAWDPEVAIGVARHTDRGLAPPRRGRLPPRPGRRERRRRHLDRRQHRRRHGADDDALVGDVLRHLLGGRGADQGRHRRHLRRPGHLAGRRLSLRAALR